MYNRNMEITWEARKAAANLHDHGIAFEDAEAVLRDPNALIREDTDAMGEQRFVALGMDANARLLIVTYTYRDEVIRLISARKASRNEAKPYERT